MTNHQQLVLLAVAALAIPIAACRVATPISPAERPSDSTAPTPLPTELSFTSVLAKMPMQDTARVAGALGSVVVVGLLNQTAPCFGLSSAATRTANRIVLRLVATEVQGTCNTFAAGAFDYDVGVTAVAAGVYEVSVLHRVIAKDGRVIEAEVGARRVEVW